MRVALVDILTAVSGKTHTHFVRNPGVGKARSKGMAQAMETLRGKRPFPLFFGRTPIDTGVVHEASELLRKVAIPLSCPARKLRRQIPARIVTSHAKQVGFQIRVKRSRHLASGFTLLVTDNIIAKIDILPIHGNCVFQPCPEIVADQDGRFPFRRCRSNQFGNLLRSKRLPLFTLTPGQFASLSRVVKEKTLTARPLQDATQNFNVLHHGTAGELLAQPQIPKTLNVSNRNLGKRTLGLFSKMLQKLAHNGVVAVGSPLAF